MDDEGDAVPRTVVDYYFVNDEDVVVDFSELPLQWKANEQLDNSGKTIYLCGKTDSGHETIFIKVTAWRFDLSYVKPRILVLSKDRVWNLIKEPMKCFVSVIRKILITIHCLHHLKKNPEICRRSLWEHLSKVFSKYDEVRPSENDLAGHTSLISVAVKRDKTLRKAKFLMSFLDEKPQKKRKAFDEDVGNTKPGFILDDDVVDEIEDDGSDDVEDLLLTQDEEDLFDCYCSICDNGGDLLCCEGRCMRSFHATVEAGSESKCESLGLSDEQLEKIQTFVCKNCQYKQHQCFVCGEIGSSDTSSGAEVFSCVSATCGRFYHPRCVAEFLYYDSNIAAKKLQKKIAEGECFTCPIHKCFRCKLGEDKTDRDLQFATCRRCPKSYHRKCLPRKIGFEDDKENGITKRAWEFVPKRILIYCLEHKIEKDSMAPVRNHLQFPDDGHKKKKPASEQCFIKEKVHVKQSSLPLEGASRKRPHEKTQKGVVISSKIKESECSTGNERRLSVLASSKKLKVVDSSRNPSPGTDTLNVNKSVRDKNVPSLVEGLSELVNKSIDEETPKDEQEKAMTEKELNSSVQLDADAKKRISALVEDAVSSITMEHVRAKHSVPSIHVDLSRNGVNKTVTVGKVEGAVEAIRAALQTLEKKGGSIEDAKAVCEPELLLQIARWQTKLKVYLAPFLHGMCHTSFGRHFTKEDKLKEIVDMLHYYVQDDDMIVDFGCGSNDFSCLMKKKLDEAGKKCSYRNYDIIQAKNDFNFEKRDWMTVQRKELPRGSQLIMGLNPPFGVNGSLANKFINKALEFKPKLIILIAPRETERLDRKRNPYDLVWEDDLLLAGKSFYIPGSLDVNGNQIEDLNISTPPLCLWSRPDWTAKHKAIARQHGHLSRLQEQPISNNPLEDHDLSMIPEDDHRDRNEVLKHVIREKGSHPSESPKEAPARDNNYDRVVHQGGDSSHWKDLDHSNKSTKQLKGRGGLLGEEGSQRGRERRRQEDSANDYGGCRSLDHHRSSRTFEAPSRRSEVDMEVDPPPFDRSSGSKFETGHAGPPNHPLEGPLPGVRTDTLGFAPGPYRSFSQHNSSGWLDE